MGLMMYSGSDHDIQTMGLLLLKEQNTTKN